MDKKRKILIARLVALVVTLISVYVFSPWQYGLYYLTSIPSSLQEVANEATSKELEGIIFYAQTGENSPQLVASGWHNRKDKVAAYPDALFKIASIEKLYVAAAVTKLVGEGKLDLSKSLAFYLPEVANRIEHSDEITLAMMVKHRSGIPNWTDVEGFSWTEKYPEPLELIFDTPADFLPDQSYSYSNSNYSLLKKIMDKVLGYPHWQYIEEVLLTPLQLNNTYQSINDVEMATLMSGYYIGYEDDFKGLEQGAVATAQDVGIFLKALNQGNFLSESEQQIYREIYEYGHTGWVLGYYSIAKYHPELDTVLIQFVNTNGADTILLSDIVYGRALDVLTSKR